jgi:hypothetical protein
MNILQITALALGLMVSGVNSQIAGTTDLCSCSPTVFNFTLDFAGTCPGNLVDADGDPINGGINESTCFVTVLAANNTNEIPVIIESAILLELNDDIVINSTTLEGPFGDGEVFTYAAISSYNNLTEYYFPFSLQITLVGENSDGITVVNTVAIVYTNDCGAWPVFPPDAQIGWIGIVSDRFCLSDYSTM